MHLTHIGWIVDGWSQESVDKRFFWVLETVRTCIQAGMGTNSCKTDQFRPTVNNNLSQTGSVYHILRDQIVARWDFVTMIGAAVSEKMKDRCRGQLLLPQVRWGGGGGEGGRGWEEGGWRWWRRRRREKSWEEAKLWRTWNGEEQWISTGLEKF